MNKKTIQILLALSLLGLMCQPLIETVSAQNSQWTLQVSNISNNTTIFNYDQILAMPATTVPASEYCYGSFVAGGNWTGVSLNYLLLQVGLDPSVASINFFASDGYTVSLQIQEATQPDVIIAYQLNNSPLAETLRLVVPDENGNMWIAMVTSITMSTSTVQPGISGGEGISLPTNTIKEPQPLPTIQPSYTSYPTPTIASPTYVASTSSAEKAYNQKSSELINSEIAIGIIIAIMFATFLAIYGLRYAGKKT